MAGPSPESTDSPGPGEHGAQCFPRRGPMAVAPVTPGTGSRCSMKDTVPSCRPEQKRLSKWQRVNIESWGSSTPGSRVAARCVWRLPGNPLPVPPEPRCWCRSVLPPLSTSSSAGRRWRLQLEATGQPVLCLYPRAWGSPSLQPPLSLPVPKLVKGPSQRPGLRLQPCVPPARRSWHGPLP